MKRFVLLFFFVAKLKFEHFCCVYNLCWIIYRPLVIFLFETLLQLLTDLLMCCDCVVSAPQNIRQSSVECMLRGNGQRMHASLYTQNMTGWSCAVIEMMMVPLNILSPDLKFELGAYLCHHEDLKFKWKQMSFIYDRLSSNVLCTFSSDIFRECKSCRLFNLNRVHLVKYDFFLTYR